MLLFSFGFAFLIKVLFFMRSSILLDIDKMIVELLYENVWPVEGI